MKFLDLNGLAYFYAKIKARLLTKVDKVEGKGLSTNDYTTAEKAKLFGIADKANSYVHPVTAGNKHVPGGGAAGQFLKWSADGTAVWGSDNNTTYGVATPSVSGLMSGADKIKLDGIVIGTTEPVGALVGTVWFDVTDGAEVIKVKVASGWKTFGAAYL